MYDEKKVVRVNELVREIKDKEDELAALFGGTAPKQRAVQRCSKCGAEGHTARTCEHQQEGSPA